jgi:hypothetical protein
MTRSLARLLELGVRARGHFGESSGPETFVHAAVRRRTPSAPGRTRPPRRYRLSGAGADLDGASLRPTDEHRAAEVDVAEAIFRCQSQELFQRDFHLQTS